MESKYKLVKVDWIDARTISEGVSIRDIKEGKVGLVKVETIGQLIYEDKEKIAVSSFIFKAERDDEIDGFRDTHIIPKKWIKKITELIEYNSKRFIKK